MKVDLIFQNSAWLIIPCLVIGAAYALFLYYKKTALSKKQNLLLSIVRGFLASLLVFLLVNPLFQNRKSIIQKPLVVLAIDNSKSIISGGNSLESKIKQNVIKIAESFSSKGIEVEIRDLNNKNIQLDDLDKNLSFDSKNTNLSKLISDIKNDFEGQNLTDVILISDGIINQGFAPTNQNYNFKIHTIGVGDSTAKKDISIIGATANKIVYLGNKFQVSVDYKALLFKGNSTVISISNGAGKVLDQKIINISKDEQIENLTFEVEANTPGKQRYKLSAKALNGESNLLNNNKDIIVEVVNGKENILLLALSPHPDIKAIKSALDRTEQFELTIRYLAELNESELQNLKFDLLILHQIPDQYSAVSNIISKLLAAQKPVFFILGAQSNISQFNGIQEVLGISASGNKIDKVIGNLNSSFNLFDFNKNANTLLGQMPPLSAPFGEYKTNPGVDVLIYQKVGNVDTQRPLLAVNINSKRKTAVLAAEGIWSWRLQEYELTDKNDIIDEYLIKTLQLISVREDKSKLRVYPISENFLVDDKVLLETEVYNNLYEKQYDKNIELTIKDEKGNQKKYNYTITKEESRFQLTDLYPGVYSYSAKTNTSTGLESTSGQFVVIESNLEMIETKADFDVLKTISNNSLGKYYGINEIDQLQKEFEVDKMPDKIISLDDLQEIINLKWLLILAILLISIEWISRKYLGTY